MYYFKFFSLNFQLAFILIIFSLKNTNAISSIKNTNNVQNVNKTVSLPYNILIKFQIKKKLITQFRYFSL